MKKIIVTILIVLLGIVACFGFLNAPVLYFIGYLATTDNMAYQLNYHIEEGKEENTFIDYFSSGKIAGEMKQLGNENASIYGSLYIDESAVPILEYYENANGAKYNISQVWNYLLQLLDDKTGLPLDWLTDTMEDCYITKAQLEQITGMDIPTVLQQEVEVSWKSALAIFAMKQVSAPETSVFADRMDDMKFYKYEAKEETEPTITIGIEKKFTDDSKLYVKVEQEYMTLETVICLTEAETEDAILLPEGELSEKQVETIQWLYDTLKSLTEEIKK